MKMIIKLRSLVALILVVILFSGFNTPANSDDPKDEVLLTILKYVLTQGHYQPNEINDQFSEHVFKEFIDQLDPSKRYFVASDIKEFSAYKHKIDDQVKSEDLTFFYLVYNRLQQRVEEAKGYYKEILSAPFDFDKKEILNIDFENSAFPKNSNEAIQVWHKQLKFNTLSRMYDRYNDEVDKAKADPNYTKKTLAELEEISRAATLKNMTDYFVRMDELTYADWFATFVNCITEEFDPHTSYLEPSMKKRFDIALAGKLEGIGARLVKENDYTKVSELVSGGPAWKQGELEVGDLILKVAQGDEEPLDIVGMRLDDAIEFIKGKKGTEVRLTVKKIDGLLKEISIIRDVVELEETFVKSSVVEMDGRTFGVINLPKFYIDFDEKNYRNSATDMAKEIERLKKDNVEGLVIDLRNNGGGSLKTAIDITGLFIDKGPVVQVKYRGRDAMIQRDKKAGVLWDGPLVVLVNELSASSSEIFAAAMQDYKRAVIIGGKQTYGKGTVQSILDLNQYHNLDEDLGALKMTIQKFYRVNGGSTQLEGVHSDISLPSRYSYMEIGERDMENALGFDRVPQATYETWDSYSNLNEVINNSKKRVSENSYFKLLDRNAKWLKTSRDDTVVPLNFELYKTDLENHKEESKQFDVLREYTSNLTYSSPSYEKPLLLNDKNLNDKRIAWHKNLNKDFYVEEAIHVLSDLKLKPKYHLVQN